MKNKILKDIIKFSKKIKGSKLTEELFENNEIYKQRIDQYFGTTRIQSILLVAVFDINSTGKEPYLNDLAKYFKCNTMELFVYQNELTQLEEIGAFEPNFTHGFLNHLHDESFSISQTAKDAIIENKPFSPCEITSLDALEICERIKRVIDKRTREDSNSINVHRKFQYLIQPYQKLPFVAYIKNLSLSDEDVLAYLYVIAHNLDGNSSCELFHFSKALFNSKKEQLYYEKEFYDKKNKLIKDGFIQLNEATFFSSASVSLTPQIAKELEEFEIPIRLTSRDKQIELLQPDTIVRKKMFYNAFAKAELENITQSLRPQKYKQITKALIKEGFKKGVCTLFYGPPGTGKTEGVYQIAKNTGRGIWKVDLSELKSSYFGESQKLVKSLFSDYTDLCKREKRTPILLLNEADAILGKRNTDTPHSTDKANNAIQNIFLDSLEDFDGILFATTNLETSLDSAFERRFLYKVNFERPNVETRSQIWASKLKDLNEYTAKHLVSHYDLSGGEIDNIVRKYKIQRILNPKIDVEFKLLELCETEKITAKKENTRIGF